MIGLLLSVVLLPAPQKLDLPEKAKDYWVTLCVQPNWKTIKREREAVDMMDQIGWAKELRYNLSDQAQYKILTVDSKEAEKYHPYLYNGTPALIIQNASGKIIYNESNPDLARCPRCLGSAFKWRLRHGDQTDPVIKEDEPIASPIKEAPPKKEGIPLWVAAVAGAGLFLVIRFLFIKAHIIKARGGA